eukprot:jgi/Mesvir1/9294/Mv04473-RA.1
MPPPASPAPASPAPAASTAKDIWTEIVESNKQAARSGKGESSRPDSNLFVVGASQGGKSTLTSRFLNPDKDDVPKPTFGLEYNFGRKSTANIERKDVAHLWEIAGGDDLQLQLARSDTLFLPLPTLPTSAVLIVVDLSKPWAAIDTVTTWLERVHNRIEACNQRWAKHGIKLPEQLLSRAKKAFGANHEDISAVNLLVVPTIIVCTKDQDAELRKIMARTMRYIAHTNGATLLYTSGLGPEKTDDKDALARERKLSKDCLKVFNAVLNHYLFQQPPVKVSETDHMKPLFVPAGQDKLKDIGRPRGADAGSGGDNAMAEWRAVFEKVFPPQKVQAQPKWVVDAKVYAEPDVDSVRAQKDEEFQSYRRQLDQVKSDRQKESSSKKEKSSRSSSSSDKKESK